MREILQQYLDNVSNECSSSSSSSDDLDEEVLVVLVHVVPRVVNRYNPEYSKRLSLHHHHLLRHYQYQYHLPILIIMKSQRDESFQQVTMIAVRCDYHLTVELRIQSISNPSQR